MLQKKNCSLLVVCVYSIDYSICWKTNLIFHSFSAVYFIISSAHKQFSFRFFLCSEYFVCCKHFFRTKYPLYLLLSLCRLVLVASIKYNILLYLYVFYATPYGWAICIGGVLCAFSYFTCENVLLLLLLPRFLLFFVIVRIEANNKIH